MGAASSHSAALLRDDDDLLGTLRAYLRALHECDAKLFRSSVWHRQGRALGVHQTCAGGHGVGGVQRPVVLVRKGRGHAPLRPGRGAAVVQGRAGQAIGDMKTAKKRANQAIASLSACIGVPRVYICDRRVML